MRINKICMYLLFLCFLAFVFDWIFYVFSTEKFQLLFLFPLVVCIIYFSCFAVLKLKREDLKSQFAKYNIFMIGSSCFWGVIQIIPISSEIPFLFYGFLFLLPTLFLDILAYIFEVKLHKSIYILLGCLLLFGVLIAQPKT